MVEKFRTGDCIGNHVGNIANTNHIEGPFKTISAQPKFINRFFLYQIRKAIGEGVPSFPTYWLIKFEVLSPKCNIDTLEKFLTDKQFL